MMMFRNKVLGGVASTFLGRAAQTIIGLLSTLVLARLLDPDDFGVWGMALLVVGIFDLFLGYGFDAAIIQQQDAVKEQVSSLFWINLLFCMILVVAMIFGAPLVASFFQKPVLSRVLPVLTLGLLLSAMSMVSEAYLRMSLSFKRLAVIDSEAVLIGSMVGIACAWSGIGTWSLVACDLARRLTRCFLLLLAHPWAPLWAWPSQSARNLVHFGLHVRVSTLVIYLTRNADDALVGRACGSEALAVYQMAYRIMLWPISRISGAIGEVLFPSLSSISGDLPRVRNIYLQMIACIGFVTFPLVVSAWVMSRHMIPLVLGAKWQEVVPLFLVLSPLGIPQSILTTSGALFLALGRADINLRMILFNATLMILSFFIGIRWGAMGVSICYALTHLVTVPVQFRVIGTLLKVRRFQFAGMFWQTAVCAIVMAAAMYGVQTLTGNSLHPACMLAIQCLVGICVYAGLAHSIHLHSYMLLRQLVLDKLATKYHSEMQSD